MLYNQKMKLMGYYEQSSIQSICNRAYLYLNYIKLTNAFAFVSH